MKKIRKMAVALLVCFCIGMVSPMPALNMGHAVEVQAASVKPKLISAKPSGTTKAVIKWQTLKSAAGYRVYRSTDRKNWKRLKTIVGGKIGSYTDSKLTTGARYYYTVRAYRKKNGKTVLSACDTKGLSMIAGLQTLTLNKTSLGIYKGKSYTLKINGTKLKPSWKSSDTSVASVDSAGKVIAKKNGTATITASLGGRKLTCKVTVKTQSLASATAPYYKKLKAYLTKYGEKDSSGNPYIAYKTTENNYEYLWGIIYEKAKDRYDFFSEMGTPEGVYCVTDMYVNVQKSGYATAEYGAYYENEYVITSSKFATKSYTGKKNIKFNIDKIYDKNDTELKNEAQGISNVCLKSGFQFWNETLRRTVKISMKNLGFTALAI